ncbi:hypothetical protein V5F59_09360 [Xanthobacter autotrophicus DSM 431]|uniref:hypothetical protein n=1 Tax=Xanthobacter nonsaccharivorans TaxID=3119912 RepID=UPI003727480B
MADYYPLLVRAISSLPQKTAEGRKAVYDRARTALMRQLRGVDPPLPEGEITRERMGLEEAIRRIEAEYAQDNEEPVVEEAPEPPASPAPPPVAPRPAEPPRERDAEAAPPPPEASARSERRGLPLRTREEESEEAADRRPPLRRGEVRSRSGAANGSGRRPTRKEGGPSWQKFMLWTLMVLVVLAGIAVAVINREAIFGGGGEPRPAAPAASSSSGEQPKNADRVAASSSEAARRVPTPPRATASGVGRAQLVEESTGSSTPQTFEGTITWKTETVNAGPGLPPDIALRGEITIPERQIALSFVLRRNTDSTLPVSHTIELDFKLPENFPFGGIANLVGVRMRPNPQAQGALLAGIPVRVNPTSYLLGLSQEPADRQRNLALLQGMPLIDTLFVYTNGKKAFMTFEKGMAGDQAFNDAFSAWGELMQRPEPPAQNNGG